MAMLQKTVLILNILFIAAAFFIENLLPTQPQNKVLPKSYHSQNAEETEEVNISYETYRIFNPESAILQSLRNKREPEQITVCQLMNNPPAYNHKLIAVTGFVIHGFENFTIFDPACNSLQSIWLEYGGKSSSGTMYCCGVTAARTRPEQLVVEEIAVPLTIDENFRTFDRLIRRSPDTIVRATIVGRFFSGEKMELRIGTLWGSYGHMGFSSLLAIERIVSVGSQEKRKDLDYCSTGDYPDLEDGCGCQDLLREQTYGGIIEFQKRVEQRERDWSFDNPQRVAIETLARLLKIDENSLTNIKLTRKAQGRFVYEWRPKNKYVYYVVTISRPIWLSYYAKDSSKVAWVAIEANKAFCGDEE